jgi:hypothetical protein
LEQEQLVYKLKWKCVLELFRNVVM